VLSRSEATLGSAVLGAALVEAAAPPWLANRSPVVDGFGAVVASDDGAPAGLFSTSSSSESELP
jgi:hypothetical protein